MGDSLFENVQTAPPIEVFATIAAYNEDTHPDKVNLSVGAYRTEEGKPWVLPVVRKVEVTMANDQSLNKEYLPITGLKDYTDACIRLVLGEDSVPIQEQRVVGVQALGGTGALRLAGDMLKSLCGKTIAYCTDPTWGNHLMIFKVSGFDEVRKFKYWDPVNRCMAWEDYKETLNTAPEGSVFVMHAVAHNPTGCDPSKEQWMEIAEIMKARNLFPLFDCAYQGFATGDLEVDAWAVRYFASQGFEMCVCQSFSKNFGMYNERVGNLVVILNDSYKVNAVQSQLQLIVRKMYSNPPSHGARLIATVLNNQALHSEWSVNVQLMAERIKLMRQKLFEKIKSLGTPGNWDHVVSQKGMFSYTGLTVRQSEFLMKEYHIYLMKSGRINMCGLTLKTLDYVATAIHEAVTTITDDAKL